MPQLFDINKQASRRDVVYGHQSYFVWKDLFMPVRVSSSIVFGIDVFLVQFEIAVESGPAQFSITGLPENIAAESRSQIYKAIRNSGFLFSHDWAFTFGFQ